MEMNGEKITESCLEILRKGFHHKDRGRRLCVVTPFLYPDDDNIEVFIKNQGESRVVVHDFGQTLSCYMDVFDPFALNNPKIQELIKDITDRHGVVCRHGVLSKDSPAEDVAQTVLDVAKASNDVSVLCRVLLLQKGGSQ